VDGSQFQGLDIQYIVIIRYEFMKLVLRVVLPIFLLSALLAFLWLKNTNTSQPKFVQQPSIMQNPNPRAPLAAILKFTPDQSVATLIEIDDGDRNWSINFDKQNITPDGHILLGMRAGRTHQIKVSITNENNETTQAKHMLTYKAPPLPVSGLNFPTIDVNKALTDRLEPGYTILSVRRRAIGRPLWLTPAQMSFTRNWSLLLILDTAGEVVWYYVSDTRISGVDQLENGNLFFHLADFRSIEIDMLGNVVGEWYAENRRKTKFASDNPIPIKGIQTLHHQPHEMPNGDFLAFSANPRSIPNYYTSTTDPDAPRKTQNVMGDSVIQFSKTGEILWRWNAFDHLDINRIGYGLFEPYWHTRGFTDHLDWTHANGVTYDPVRNDILISLRVQDAIISIDRETSEINWILGDHQGWSEEFQSKLLTPIGDNFRWPFHGHNPRITAEDTLVMFDNGILQARPFDKPLPPDQTFSRGVEFKVDEDAMTVRQLWSSTEQLSDDDSCNSWAMGDAHRLPKTGNMLIIYAFCVPRIEGLSYDERDATHRHVDDFPTQGIVREYTYTKPRETLLEVKIHNPDDMMQWEIYGGLHTASLYSASK